MAGPLGLIDFFLLQIFFFFNHTKYSETQQIRHGQSPLTREEIYSSFS